jgi:hypothetical protein
MALSACSALVKGRLDPGSAFVQARNGFGVSFSVKLREIIAWRTSKSFDLMAVDNPN